MKKTLLLMLLTAFTAVASFAQPAKRSPELRVLTAEQLKKELAAKPMPAKKAQAPRKANVTVDDLVGNYSAKVNNHTYKVTLKASDVEGEVILSGLWEFDDFKATVDAENSRLAIELGQVVFNHHSWGKIILGVYKVTSDEIVTTGTLYALVNEDGSITFPANVYICMIIAEGDYAGNTYYSYIYPVLTLTPGFPDETAVTPWDDVNLSYLSTEGDVVGDWNTLVTGVAYKDARIVDLYITTTNLVNVEDPDDQLLLSVGDNLYGFNPIQVGEEELSYKDAVGADNKPFSTLAGEHEYIFIDNYGSASDFEAVKDVLEGKIAVCNRGGGISYYIKANAAVANGAIGLIVVNNQNISTDMNLSGYEYDKPVVSIALGYGASLKSNATYVDGDAPYYRGTLTISDEEKYEHNNIRLTYGHGQETVEGEVRAVVQDWSKATPGATYQATINYQATHYNYDEENSTLTELGTEEVAPTTLTLRVPDENLDFVFTPWDDIELTYGSTEGVFVGSPNTLISGLATDSRDYVTVKVTSTELANYWYESEPSLSLDYGGNMNTTYYFGYGYEPYSEEFDVRAVIPSWKNVHIGNPYVAEISYEVTYYKYLADTDSYADYHYTAEQTWLYIEETPNEIVFTPWADSELTYGNTEGDVVGIKSALLSGMPESDYGYASVLVSNTHLINVADPNDQLILALKAPTWESDNLKDYNPLYVAGKEIEYAETSYNNEPISTIMGDHEFIYIDNYGTEEDFAAVKDVLEGKIAVCNRGSISFYVKANAAMANGAAGIIIVNNQEGSINMDLTGYEYTNPAVSIKMADGKWLMENATYVDGDAPYYHGTLTVGEPVKGHDTYSMALGYNSDTGEYYSDYEMKAYVYDWTNATPGATYQATITYTSGTYYDYYVSYYQYVGMDIEMGTSTTTLTVTIPSDEPEVTFTPWPDLTLTYGNEEGDVVGNTSTILSGVAEDTYDYAYVAITNTHLVNVADPDDKLVMSLKTQNWENLIDYSPIFVDGQEIEYTETTGYGNESISTLAGQTLEYIYIDSYGTAEDFAAVKDVLEGKIAICNRGSISFYIKANAAVENGAIGLIVVNNQEGTVNMNLDGYEYDKPAVAVTMATGTLLKNSAEYVTDGAAPYYLGTLKVNDVETGHSKSYLAFGEQDYYGNIYSTYDVYARVPDWTNATPGATYQATINYSECIYYRFDPDFNEYEGYPIEIGTPSTTVTVTIPEENSIEDITAGRNADGRMYNLLGIPVGKDYKGIVIQNGRKVLR